MNVRVEAVIVVPMSPEGIAYAHTAGGRCLTLRGAREQMIDLCKRVKAATLENAPPIYVNVGEFLEMRFLVRDECPVHDVAAA